MNTDDEIQLTDDLRHIVAGVRFEADLQTIERRGRGARRRTAAVRGVAGISVLALAAGGAYLGLHTSTTSHTGNTAAAGTSTSKAPATEQVETAAYVVKQAQAALADVSDYMIKDDVTAPSGNYEMLTDPRTGSAYEVSGTGSSRTDAWNSTYVVNNVLHWKDVEANYGTHTWFVSIQSAGAPMQEPLPPGPVGGAGGTAGQVKKWLDSGVYKIVGHGDSNGHQVTKLQRPWAAGYLEVWVDSQTYQPVHVIQADFANEDTPQKSDIMTTDETWLPRTDDNVSLANTPRIPAGFTQVAPPK